MDAYLWWQDLSLTYNCTTLERLAKEKYTNLFWAQKATVFNWTKLECIAMYKHFSLLGPFVSY